MNFTEIQMAQALSACANLQTISFIQGFMAGAMLVFLIFIFLQTKVQSKLGGLST